METDGFDLDCQHSRFPVPSSRLTQDIKLVALEAQCNVDHKVVGDDSLLLRAWAMLLHAYVRQESVCFIKLPPLISTDELGWAGPQYASAGCCELTIARYHVGTSSTGKKGTFDYRACGRSYLQSGRCNTGLVFSDIDPTGYGLNGDAEISSVMAHFGQNLSQVSPVLLNFNQRYHSHECGAAASRKAFGAASVKQTGLLPLVVLQHCSTKLIIGAAGPSPVYCQKTVKDFPPVSTPFYLVQFCQFDQGHIPVCIGLFIIIRDTIS